MLCYVISNILKYDWWKVRLLKGILLIYTLLLMLMTNIGFLSLYSSNRDPILFMKYSWDKRFPRLYIFFIFVFIGKQIYAYQWIVILNHAIKMFPHQKCGLKYHICNICMTHQCRQYWNYLLRLVHIWNLVPGFVLKQKGHLTFTCWFVCRTCEHISLYCDRIVIICSY